MGHEEYKGGATSYHPLSENIRKVSKDYPIHNGYFGEDGEGRHKTREITSDNPLKTAKDFYDKIAYGGIEEDLANGKGVKTTMEDGTIITMREQSSSDGSPAVNINIKYSSDSAGIKDQKIHFKEAGNDN